MSKLVLASNNTGKLKELQHLLGDLPFEVIPQGQLGIAEVAETGLTFLENAILKARHAASQTQLPALADDSGLVVPALGGQPGIYSARYAGENASSKDCIAKLLANMKLLSEDERQAYFYCTLVYLRTADDPCPIIAEGMWSGQILSAPRGDKGFGYDPIFYDLKLKLSAAELSPEIKNKVSHRGQAMNRLASRLKDIGSK